MDEGIDQVLGAHPEQVEAWLAHRAGAWGFLAGQAVLAERRRLGRGLTESERRVVWQALWNRLSALRAGDF